jgi:disulfide bond formation protein DsbB
MTTAIRPPFSPVSYRAALLLLVGALATLLGALAFQHFGGYEPCVLCLKQRDPYYAAIPVACAAALGSRQRAPLGFTRGMFAALMLLTAYGAALGAYHAGVEWTFWEGPAACAPAGGAPADAGAVIESLRGGVTGPSCTEAVWRFLGLSFAGWNVLVSLALVLVAAFGFSRAQGSSTASQ